MGIATGIIMHRTARYQELTRVGLIYVFLLTGLFAHFGAVSSLVEIVIYQLINGFRVGDAS